jgi:hypothetical protein
MEKGQTRLVIGESGIPTCVNGQELLVISPDVGDGFTESPIYDTFAKMSNSRAICV